MVRSVPGHRSVLSMIPSASPLSLHIPSQPAYIVQHAFVHAAFLSLPSVPLGESVKRVNCILHCSSGWASDKGLRHPYIVLHDIHGIIIIEPIPFGTHAWPS